MLLSYLPKLKVKTFGITSSLMAIMFIAFWVVTPCNLVDYKSVVLDYVTWDVVIFKCVSIMCLSTVVKVSHTNSQEVTYKKRPVKKYKHGIQLFENMRDYEVACVHSAYELHQTDYEHIFW